MQITVVKGQTRFQLDVDSNTPIDTIMELIKDRLNIPTERQRLTYNNQRLEAGNSLAAYIVQQNGNENDVTIYLDDDDEIVFPYPQPEYIILGNFPGGRNIRRGNNTNNAPNRNRSSSSNTSRTVDFKKRQTRIRKKKFRVKTVKTKRVIF